MIADHHSFLEGAIAIHDFFPYATPCSINWPESIEGVPAWMWQIRYIAETGDESFIVLLMTCAPFSHHWLLAAEATYHTP